MAFFPLPNSSKADGFCTVHNFTPNNWEPVKNSRKTVWAIYSNGDKWITKELDKIEVGESKKYFYDEIYRGVKKQRHPLILLQFRNSALPKTLNNLPYHQYKYNKVPEWRATVGFKINKNETSYQGEINPFPTKASLLTFHPFIQYKRITNYFLFVNIENTPEFRKETLEIYEAKTKKIIDKVNIYSNNCNLIEIDRYNFQEDELPIFVCRKMAGIPFGLGISDDKKMLSLEHTHPPASFVVHGDRFKVQSEIKLKWFNILKS
tara:strand:- start:3000 stop:3788 length:789 start_codon:yes stop_codon:yes gene_type:complete